MTDTALIGTVTEIEHPYADPGSISDYNQQQFRRLKATGVNCTDYQFAQKFVELIGGLICGDQGTIVDLGEVPDNRLDCELSL